MAKPIVPRSIDRGPIEAPTYGPGFAHSARVPRSIDRGPIEALDGTPRSHFLPMKFRDQLIAAPLKRFKPAHWGNDVAKFRDQLIAAPLKPSTFLRLAQSFR